MNYSHNIYTLPSISGELRTFTINRWQYKDLSRVSVSKRAVCSYKKKMNTLYGVWVGGFFKGSEIFSGKFKGYENFPKNCKGYENFPENCKGSEIFLENCKGYENF